MCLALISLRFYYNRNIGYSITYCYSTVFTVMILYFKNKIVNDFIWKTNLIKALYKLRFLIPIQNLSEIGLRFLLKKI